MTTENIEFDEALWEEEQRKLREAKRRRYESCLGFILKEVCEAGESTLDIIREKVLTNEEYINELIPDIDVFKEVMVELLRERFIDINALKKERGEVISDPDEIFEINYMLLELLERYDGDGLIKTITVEKLEDSPQVVFEGVRTADGAVRNIRCSNVRIKTYGV